MSSENFILKSYFAKKIDHTISVNSEIYFFLIAVIYNHAVIINKHHAQITGWLFSG